MATPNTPGTNPIVPTASLNTTVPAVDQTAIDAAHGMHVIPEVHPHLVTDASLKILPHGEQVAADVMSDGYQELGKLDAHGNPAPKY